MLTRTATRRLLLLALLEPLLLLVHLVLRQLLALLVPRRLLARKEAARIGRPLIEGPFFVLHE